MAVKVVKHFFEGTWDGETYEVLVDGERAGTVRRRDSVSTGYYGRWAVVHGPYWTDTRRDAVRYVVNRHQARQARRTTP